MTTPTMRPELAAALARAGGVVDAAIRATGSMALYAQGWIIDGDATARELRDAAEAWRMANEALRVGRASK